MLGSSTRTLAPSGSLRSQSLPLFVLRGGALFLLLISLPLGYWGPVQWGWENHLLEDLQLGVLVTGLGWALREGFRSSSKPTRAGLGWVFAIVLGLAIGRELSWGTVFFPAVSIDPETGPSFPATQQIPGLRYVMLLVPIGLGLALVLALRYRLPGAVRNAFQNRMLPFVEVVLAGVVGLILQAGFYKPLFSHQDHPRGHLQATEETLELAIYLLVLAAGWKLALWCRATRR